MGTPEEFPEGADLAVVPAADHGLRVPTPGPLDQAEALDLVVESHAGVARPRGHRESLTGRSR